MADDRKRRLPLRWLTLAELVGIAALVIAGLGYWDTHRQRAESERDRAAEVQAKKAEAQAGALKRTFLLTGTPEADGQRLRLSPAHPEQVIETQSISFPGEVRGDPVQTTGAPRLEAGWFEGGLARALHDRGDPHRSGRLPVAVVTSYIEDGQSKTDRALYLVGYSLHPRVLRGDKAELEGLSLARRLGSEDVQAALDALWARQAPAKPKG